MLAPSRSVVSDSAAPWPLAHQAPLSTGFSRQEYWSGLPFPSPCCFPNPGIQPRSLALADGFFITSTSWEALTGIFRPLNVLNRYWIYRELNVINSVVQWHKKHNQAVQYFCLVSLLPLALPEEVPGCHLSASGAWCNVLLNMAESPFTSCQSVGLLVIIPATPCYKCNHADLL